MKENLQVIIAIISGAITILTLLLSIKLPVLRELNLANFSATNTGCPPRCDLANLVEGGRLNKRYFYAIVWDGSKWIRILESGIFLFNVVFFCIALPLILGPTHELYQISLGVAGVLFIFYSAYFIRALIFNLVIMIDVGITK